MVMVGSREGSKVQQNLENKVEVSWSGATSSSMFSPVPPSEWKDYTQLLLVLQLRPRENLQTPVITSPVLPPTPLLLECIL